MTLGLNLVGVEKDEAFVNFLCISFGVVFLFIIEMGGILFTRIPLIGLALPRPLEFMGVGRPRPRISRVRSCPRPRFPSARPLPCAPLPSAVARHFRFPMSIGGGRIDISSNVLLGSGQ